MARRSGAYDDSAAYPEAGGMHVGRRYCTVRQLTGVLLVLVGVLLVFLCLPMQFFLIVFGVALAAAGFLLLK